MNTAIIAHRGASELANKENTLESFLLAIDIKADYIEFDIRRTLDKVLVVFHDDSINGKMLSDITYAELSKEASKENFTVPLLVDVLKVCSGKIKLDIELKEAGYEKEIIDLVKKYFTYDDFLMKSFVDRAVLNVKNYDPDIKAGLLLGKKIGDFKRRFNEYFPMRRLKLCRADFISPNKRIATVEFILRMHFFKKEVYVWTINETDVIEKFLRRRVDGIITDRPDVALKIKEQR